MALCLDFLASLSEPDCPSQSQREQSRVQRIETLHSPVAWGSECCVTNCRQASFPTAALHTFDVKGMPNECRRRRHCKSWHLAAKQTASSPMDTPHSLRTL